MIDPTDPRPASSIPTVDPQHQQADCQPIVEPSILNAQRALADAPPDDDAQWIAIVLASLSSRSCQAKEALLKALAHDRSRVKPAGSTTMTETTESLHEQNRVHPSRSGRAIFSIRGHPSPLIGFVNVPDGDRVPHAVQSGTSSRRQWCSSSARATEVDARAPVHRWTPPSRTISCGKSPNASLVVFAPRLSAAACNRSGL